MMTTILNRLAAPALIFVVGSTFGIFLQQRVLSKPVNFRCPKIPDCKCPQPELQSIDFEKVKNFKGTINLHQHYNVQVENDSTLLYEAIRDAFKRNANLNKK